MCVYTWGYIKGLVTNLAMDVVGSVQPAGVACGGGECSDVCEGCESWAYEAVETLRHFRYRQRANHQDQRNPVEDLNQVLQFLTGLEGREV